MNYNRIVFVGEAGVLRAPMAAGIMKKIMPGIECVARGLVVLFPEPMNQKAESVLKSHDIEFENFASTPLVEDDFAIGTLVVVMERPQLEKILAQFENANPEHVHVLTEYVEEELEILNPYGQPLQVYGMCYETLLNSLTKLKEKIQEAYNE